MASEPGNTLTDTDPIAVSAGNSTRATGLAVCVGNGTMANEPRNTLTDPEIWDKIEAILSSIVIAESSRPELQGGGICVGVTNVKSTCIPKIGTHTYAYESEVSALICAFRSLSCWPGVPFTSIQMNTGRTSVHVDKPNVDLSTTFSVGDFSGGSLWLDGESIATWHSPLVFNGKTNTQRSPSGVLGTLSLLSCMGSPLASQSAT